MSGATPIATAAETPDQALARAQAAAQARRFGEAAGICDDVLATAPDHPPAFALLGMIAAQTNDPERGIALLERAVTAQPGVASWYANLGALYRMVYRMQDALRVGQEAIRLDPQNADHLVSLSLAFTDVDDREHAIVCLLAGARAEARSRRWLIWRSARTCWRWAISSQAGENTSGATRPRQARARCPR